MHLLYFAVKFWLWGIPSTVIFVKTEARIHCLLKPRVGLCKAAHERWFFNYTSRRCDSFIYGGCGGNENNFMSKDECQRKCPGNVNWDRFATRYICSLSAAVGRCRAAFPRWHFNWTTKRCENFIYGGCGGNRNNFLEQSDCEKFCADFLRDPCAQPIIVASSKSCHAEKKDKRYGYNRKTGKCEKFEHSTCKENMNSFTSRKECLETCASDSPCLYATKYHRARFYTSYFYDAGRDECRATSTFAPKKDFYPKDNRFGRKNECQRECMPVHMSRVKTQER